MILAIIGATATGKTDLAIRIALEYSLPIEIIALDSATIYRDMNIGTSKPTIAQRQGIRHHMLDIITPEEDFSVTEYIARTNKIISEIRNRNAIPMLVGGTMMYYKALRFGIANLPKSSPFIRQKLTKQYEENPQLFHSKLAKIDPKTAERLHTNDAQRIIRAMEVIEISGSKFSELQTENKLKCLEEIATISVEVENKNLLHKQIEQRFLRMLKVGLLQEVRELLTKYNLKKFKSAAKIPGYKEPINFIANKCKQLISKDQMIEKTLTATRNLAKRQGTWLRSFNPELKINAFPKELVGEGNVHEIFISNKAEVFALLDKCKVIK